MEASTQPPGPEDEAVAGPAVAGPAVVAIGGGHGLSATLRALRHYAGSIVAVVSVADDGGSSGRLRDAHPGLPAPGDVRRCLGALADERSVLGAALDRRFAHGELAGHALGNLVLASFTEALGSFGAAVDELATLVGAVGRVLPATVEPVALEGLRTGPDPSAGGPLHRVLGQVAVQNATGLARLGLQPRQPASPPEVAEAILAADQVVLGPGSLFTSVLAAAVVPDVNDALVRTGAGVVYVANLAPQPPETAGFTVADEVEALGHHAVHVDVVVADPRRLAGDGCDGYRPDDVALIEAPVADLTGRSHDPRLLAEALTGLVSQARTALR